MSSTSHSRLAWGKNFSLGSRPQINPTASSPHVLVIGGGVTGLTTAWVLLDRGYYVTIVAKEWASYGWQQRLTSQIAGALWEFPPAVCGQHTDAISLHKSKKWCMVAYRVWSAIAADPALGAAAGVKMRHSTFFFPHRIEEDARQLAKMREIERSGIKGFRRDTTLVQQLDINPSYGAVDAYEHLAPVIDTDRAMDWLMTLVQRKGAVLITDTIHGDLFAQEDELRLRFGADAIVNATGLASAETAGDETCYPIRGALLRVINDGTDFPQITRGMTISIDVSNKADGIVFIVPRNDNILLLGGIVQPHERLLDLTPESPVIQEMRRRCEKFLPALKKARLDPDYPISQGLRPFRQRNVRVERELRRRKMRPHSRIIHSYGQGGAGWSLAFGCAEDVAALVEEALRDLPVRPMAVSEPPQIRARL
jgi:glycine/D-amino acid oxidase-like deaminating enzyme